MTRSAWHAWVVLAALVSLALPAAARAAATLPLAADGQALQPIVVAETASEATRAVADELARYLGRIAGAEFTVQTGDGSRGIVLGTLAEFPGTVPIFVAGGQKNGTVPFGVPELQPSLEIRHQYDGREAFAIRTEPARLLLIGATELGASHAAFRLLEYLGCRWYFPNEAWEVVPAVPRLSVSLDETDRPRILARRIWYGYGAFADKGHPHGGSTLKDYEAWARHNRMASSFRVSAGHAWQAIIADNRQAFAEHPEYLALVKEKRQGPQLCVSQPEVQRLALEHALKFFEKFPDREMVSLECSDGYGQCECEACAKLGSVSDRVFGLANHVARQLQERLPGKMVGCLAYAQHSEPPAFALEPNLYVQLTAGFTEGRWTHDELLELWPQKCRNLGFYEYFSVWLWDFDRLPGGHGADLARTKSMLDRYLQAGATSFDAESGNNWGLHGRGYYIANKLLWNPDGDVAAWLADFYRQAFGPAAATMQHYYERVAPEGKPLVSRSLVGEAFRDVQEATRLAAGRPDVLARLDQLKHYLRYVHLRWQLDHEKDKTRQKELTVAALTLVYRTRYEYMNHWGAMRQTWAEEAATKFDEPTWQPSAKGPKPWLVDAPVTPEETAAWFREGLDYFQPTPVTEVAFSRDLVPASFTDRKPAASQQSYQREQTYALGSRAGEPLAIELTAGLIVHYRNRPAAAWTLSDAAGAVLASGAVPLDGEPRAVSLPVPQPGVYLFTCQSTAGWRIKVEPGRPAALLNARGQRVIHLAQMQEMFFYVPRGTRALQYFWSGGPHKVFGPHHEVLAEVIASDEIVTVPVPPGQDGQVWSLSPRAHTQLWFFNAPNLIAASPSALVLPREVVP